MYRTGISQTYLVFYFTSSWRHYNIMEKNLILRLAWAGHLSFVVCQDRVYEIIDLLVSVVAALEKLLPLVPRWGGKQLNGNTREPQGIFDEILNEVIMNLHQLCCGERQLRFNLRKTIAKDKNFRGARSKRWVVWWIVTTWNLKSIIGFFYSSIGNINNVKVDSLGISRTLSAK